MKKILCICNHGNVRSAALKYLIWRLNGNSNIHNPKNIKYESIAVGAHSTTDKSLKYFINWADKVVDLSDDVESTQIKLRKMAKEKYIRFHIGKDIWRNSMHPDLHNLLKNFVEEIKNEK